MHVGVKYTGGVAGWTRERIRCPYYRVGICIIVLITCSQLYSGYDKMHVENTSITAGRVTASLNGVKYDSSTESHDDLFNYHSSKDLRAANATGPLITQSNKSSTNGRVIDLSTLAAANQIVDSSTTAQDSARISTALPRTTVDDVSSTIQLPQTMPHGNWETFYHVATSPIPSYTKEHAKEATRHSSWQCTADPAPASNNGTIVAFVHVYKAAGTTIREFFHELAYSCHRTWVSLAKCTGVLPSTIQSRKKWKPCAIEEVADGRHQRKEQYMYPRAKNFKRRYRFPPSNPSFEKFVDIYGGHARLGTGEYIYPNSHPKSQSSVRYIVFLRDPIERYVSGMLYQNKVHARDETLEEIVQKVKKRISSERRRDRYWDKSLSYLLTPEQRVADYRFTTEQLKMLQSNGSIPSNTTLPSLNAEVRAKLAIHNLYEYNSIIGMTERMSESLDILRHVLLNGPENPQKVKAQAVFAKFDPASSQSKGVTANKSVKREVSTSAVVAEMAKDEEHMNLLLEYVKYERMITDFAWTMHNLQYDCIAAT